VYLPSFSTSVFQPLLRLKNRLAVLTVLILMLSGIATAQETYNRSISVVGGGTLTYVISVGAYVTCHPSPLTYYQVTQYENFVYIDSNGVSHTMSGSIYYRALAGPGSGTYESGCPIPTGSGKGNDPESASLTSSDGSGNSIYFNLPIGVQEQPNGTATATFSGSLNPQYYVLSVLYAPPGNSSSNGYTDTTSNGTSSTISKNFSVDSSTNIVASGSIFGVGTSYGVSFGFGGANGSSQSYQETYSLGSGTQIQSVKNPVDHTQDQFYIWLNPLVTVSLVGTSTTASYSMGTQGGEPMDVININAADLMNPPQIPIAVLLPQTPTPGVTLPGLANICAHPLPVAQCTQANACGCVASDFATILANDPLIGTSQTTQPNQVDSNRYVYVNSAQLEGPECSGCDPVKNTIAETDSTLNGTTESSSVNYSVGYSYSGSIGISVFGTGGKLQITDTNKFTWTNSESYGSSNGSAHTATVTLGSSSVDCSESIDVYEDTVYHTFAFAPSATPPAACN
jgi:hypothetical protein